MSQLMKTKSGIPVCLLIAYGLFFFSSCKCSNVKQHKINAINNTGDLQYVVPHTIIGECRRGEIHNFVFEIADDVAQSLETTYSQAISLKGLTVTRVKPVTNSYNSHGMTFDNSKSRILGDYVYDMLRKAGYSNSANCDPAPAVGDIIIYEDDWPNGNDRVTHSGVVISVTGGNILIRSKWGDGPEYEHAPKDILAEYKRIFYYRQSCS